MVDQKDVPQQVIAALKSKYSNGNITESETSESATGMTYEFAVKLESQTIEVVTNKNGRIENSHKEDETGMKAEEDD